MVNERGTTTKRAKVNTGVKEFIDFVKSVPRPRKIYIEEGELAGWMLERSLKFGEKLVITDPKINKWIQRIKKKQGGSRFAKKCWCYFCSKRLK